MGAKHIFEKVKQAAMSKGADEITANFFGIFAQEDWVAKGMTKRDCCIAHVQEWATQATSDKAAELLA